MSYPLRAPGPFQVDQLRSGDPYELSEGHPIQCLPTGSNGTGPNGRGFVVLDTDPAAPAVGVDAGIALSNNTLRAPDLVVGIGPERPGWSTTVPPLVVEYAADGQDNADLDKKIDEFHAAGTRWVWVVRLTGTRRVEVHERGRPTRAVPGGQSLEAPGVLKNPVPVDALYDRDAAHEVALRNLLQRKGYDSLDALRSEGREEGREEGFGPTLRLYTRRLGRPLSEAERTTLLRRLGTVGPEGITDTALDLDPEALTGWLSDPDPG